MVLWKVVLQSFDKSGGGDGADDKRDPDGFESLRRKRFGAASPAQKLCRSPATGGKPPDSVCPNEIVNFTALNICGAVIAAVCTRVTRAGPRFG